MNILFFTFLLCQSLPESSGKSYTRSKVGRVSAVVELNSLLDGHSSTPQSLVLVVITGKCT